jgi:2-polyprenyl-3-methyl-5-hydroxy-6-metoxy-1,4-benzoquinol methylase
MVYSPFFPGKVATVVRNRQVGEIVNAYQKALKIDVSAYFEGLGEIEICECPETKFRFYSPAHLAGDSAFYEQLQAFTWYYMPWKWEHQTVKDAIRKNEKVLEIGCGVGSFIKKCQEDGIDALGLELNQNAVREAVRNNVNVVGKDIADIAGETPNSYDVVCSFQVMEHIPDVSKVIQASVDSLKPGGRLFISVPNNDSFLGLDDFNELNLPPHHMGLWNRESLSNLARVFSIGVANLYFEPLQDYHVNYFNRICSDHIERNYGATQPLLRKLWPSRWRKVQMDKMLRRFPYLKNYTIIAEFVKI